MMSLTVAKAGVRRVAVLSLLAAAACQGTNLEPNASPEASGGDRGGGGAHAGTVGTATGGDGGSGAPSIMAKTSKVDLLFVIDNSASMADKQQVLGVAVRDLVSRLTNPLCVDAQSGNPLPRPLQPSTAQDPCPDASAREFPATDDVHIGVISSSLGGHGADSCSHVATMAYSPRMEDMAHLLSGGASGPVPTYDDAGFLNWDPKQHDSPAGEADRVQLASRFGDIVLGVGQDGCGFEATLESWYRFLVDPAPYLRMVPAPCHAGDTAMACRAPEGVDQALLQQREAFLRPDSAVAIVMLTDENDCSIADGDQSYLALQALVGASPFHVARGTDECMSDPGSPACESCWTANGSAHPECAAGWSDAQHQDALNLRCYRQKERFGLDFLQPVQRYIDALTKTTLPDGTLNPLFCSKRNADGTSCDVAMRDPSLVVLAGIVGVPWQDIARDPSDLSKGYRTAGEVMWDQIVGSEQGRDPLMVESVAPRTGTNPATGAELSAPGALPANPINGGEWDIALGNDLQYACAFALPAPVDSSQGGDCAGSPQSPLCRDPSTHAYGQTQFLAKAYPGLRQLEVLRGLGDSAVVASICPANLSDPARADFGYRPAMGALGDRLRSNLRP